MIFASSSIEARIEQNTNIRLQRVNELRSSVRRVLREVAIGVPVYDIEMRKSYGCHCVLVSCCVASTTPVFAPPVGRDELVRCTEEAEVGCIGCESARGEGGGASGQAVEKDGASEWECRVLQFPGR